MNLWSASKLVEFQSSEDWAKGNLAVPGGSLTSRPTWSNTSSGCSITSALLLVSAKRRNH